MNEDEPSTPLTASPMLVSILACILALGAILYTFNFRGLVDQSMEGHQEQIKDYADVQSVMAEYRDQIAVLEKNDLIYKDAIDRIRLYSSQREKVTQQITRGVEANRDELIQLIEQLNLGSEAQVRASDEEKNLPGAEALKKQSLPSLQMYRIKAGDNFARIAQSNGLELQALLEANPSVDPRRLQIGQEVVIPQN